MSLRLTPVGVMDAMPKKGRIPTMFLPNPKKEPNLSNKRVHLQFTLCTYVNDGKVYPYNSKKRGCGVSENTV